MRKPYLSIILPTFNCGNYIETCVSSILSQEFKDFEVLIFDNCSTDGSVQSFEKLIGDDKRFSLISEKDNGVYDAMNKGINISKGEWLFFLGSDDSFYDATVLKRIIKVIEQNRSAKLVYGNVKKHYPDGMNKESHFYDGAFTGEKLLQKNICHQAIFYHRSLFRKFGRFNLKYKVTADWDFNLRCFNQVNSVFFDIPVTNFFAGGLSGTVTDSAFHEDFLYNLVHTYPYSYKTGYFKNQKKLLFNQLKYHLKKIQIKKAFATSRVLFYHLGFNSKSL